MKLPLGIRQKRGTNGKLHAVCSVMTTPPTFVAGAKRTGVASLMSSSKPDSSLTQFYCSYSAMQVSAHLRPTYTFLAIQDYSGIVEALKRRADIVWGCRMAQHATILNQRRWNIYIRQIRKETMHGMHMIDLYETAVFGSSCYSRMRDVTSETGDQSTLHNLEPFLSTLIRLHFDIYTCHTWVITDKGNLETIYCHAEGKDRSLVYGSGRTTWVVIECVPSR